jgi:hypothetical protein
LRRVRSLNRALGSASGGIGLAVKLNAESVEWRVHVGFLLISAQIHLVMDGYQA